MFIVWKLIPGTLKRTFVKEVATKSGATRSMRAVMKNNPNVQEAGWITKEEYLKTKSFY